MELEQIFYTFAALFTLAAIIYFAWEYLDVLPRITKSVLLFGLSVIFFLGASVLRTRELRTTRPSAGRAKVRA